MRPGRHLAAAALRPLLLLTLNATRHAFVGAHAPTYADECPDNCCRPKRDDHTFSQAFYLQGEGGVEVHVDDIDVAGEEILHWDVVFRGDYRERPRSSDYELYVGCGGCAKGDPYVATSYLAPKEVLEPVLEPFTQTSYYPLYDKDDPIREFNSAVLADCAPTPDGKKHFTIRLKPLTSKPIFWAPVVGCPEFRCELPAFGAYEIFVFPYYILHNQRGAWSEYYEGIWIAIGIATVLVALLFLCPLFCCRCSAFCCRVCGNGCGKRFRAWEPCCGPRPEEEDDTAKDVCARLRAPMRTLCTRIPDHEVPTDRSLPRRRVFSLRGLLYTVAVWAMLVSLANASVNVVHSLDRLDPPYEYESMGMSLFFWVIVFWGHVLPLTLVAIIWWKATNVPESRWRAFYYGGARPGTCTRAWCYNYCNCRSPYWAHGCWWWLEFFGVGLAGFFCLGTGYYVCPAAITAAAVYRAFLYYASGAWWTALKERWRRGPQGRGRGRDAEGQDEADGLLVDDGVDGFYEETPRKRTVNDESTITVARPAVLPALLMKQQLVHHAHAV